MTIEEIDKSFVKLQERITELERELVEWLRAEKTKFEDEAIALKYKIEEQIETMKCCANCVNQFDEYECTICKNKSGWRLAD